MESMMNVSDQFIGNLRAARDVATGRRPIATPPVSSAQPAYIPPDTDKPTNRNTLKYEQVEAANNGMRFDNESRYKNSPVYNWVGNPGRNLNYREAQQVLPYAQLFTDTLTQYMNEPDTFKRMSIIENAGKNTPLGSLPGVIQYLASLYNEDKMYAETPDEYGGDEEYRHFNPQYKDRAQAYIRMLNANLNKFNPSA